MMSEELNEFDGDMAGGEAAAQPQATGQAGAQAASRSMAPGPDNVVILPAGQDIESLTVDGADLVIVLSDGTRIVVPDGAILIPQLVIGDVPVPAANVAALLVGNEPEPAAGLTPSSGGNFAVDPGEIQSAFDIGDLLPYTDLPVARQVEEEVIPDRINEEPEVLIETPDAPNGVENATATVREDGLPARGQAILAHRRGRVLDAIGGIGGLDEDFGLFVDPVGNDLFLDLPGHGKIGVGQQVANIEGRLDLARIDRKVPPRTGRQTGGGFRLVAHQQRRHVGGRDRHIADDELRDQNRAVGHDDTGSIGKHDDQVRPVHREAFDVLPGR